MATAWPNLNVLELVLRPWRHMVRIPTTPLRCLVPFAMHCHSLTRLNLLLDARSVSPLDLSPQHHKQILVNLGSSPIDDPVPVSVAAFLSSVFPLVYIRSERRYSEPWNKVTPLVELFGAVRDQEREKAVKAIEGNEESSVELVKCELLCSFVSSLDTKYVILKGFMQQSYHIKQTRRLSHPRRVKVADPNGGRHLIMIHRLHQRLCHPVMSDRTASQIQSQYD